MGRSEALMDYNSVPTTVFTPMEYGTIGLNEDEANREYGADNIDAWHTKFKPLEWEYDKFGPQRFAYTKVLVNRADDKVVGFHICCPNAGEITQGVAIAFKMGMTKA